MKTLHTALRVGDLSASVEFYTTFGFRELGRVEPGDGRTLVMLLLPEDDRVTLELVEEPAVAFERGTAVSHLVVQVDDLDATVGDLATKGLSPDPPSSPVGGDGPRTSFIEDPNGYRIELVQWPAGHADGITDADFEPSTPAA